MSKTNVCSRLSALFSSTKNAAKTINPKPQKSQPMKNLIVKPNVKPKLVQTSKPKNLNLKISELLRETDPHTLIERFKDLSKYSYFRENCLPIYKLTLNRFALSGQQSLIIQALESQQPYISREGLAMRVIHLYGRYGLFDHAQKVFDELPERKIKRGVKCFSSLLGAASNSGKFDKVYELFRELPEKLSVKPNADCYNTAMNALCKMGKVDDAVALLGEMEAKGVKPDVISFNTLLYVYYEKGDFEKGEELWERMIKSKVVPDIQSYNFKSRGLVNDGKLDEAVDLVMQLRSDGLKPVTDTFNALIEGFIKDDDVDGAIRWYDEMVKRGRAPNRATFSTLAPFFCEKNDYGSAFELCKKIFQGNRRVSVDESVLQNVVDGLAKNSMVEEARTIVELGRSCSYLTYNLVIPDTVE